jgi:hypothetical protein
MDGPYPLHTVPCSFCGTPVSCRCVNPRDHRRWCPSCEDRYVIPSAPPRAQGQR